MPLQKILVLFVSFCLLPLGCKSGPKSDHMHTNALIHEASPYLLQHAHNPVNWLPWSDDAFERAKRENKPVFLSVGYAACHWCHVMEHESFENDTIAAYLNEHFIAIKVDREERPDIDHHYMQAVQRLAGRGGWPMSVFLTPDKKPFFGGTYWPPESRYGRPGFMQILENIHTAWTERRDELVSSADELHGLLDRQASRVFAPGEINPSLFNTVIRQSEQNYDSTYGGFGAAPKFPHAMELATLLREYQRSGNPQARIMVENTLDRMARGGIYDQIGGGFARYSTDARWLVPHFEKMLYDNALLIPLYLDASIAFEREDFRRVAAESIEWALREMELPEGGFASSLDADSEGEEGKFYVWIPTEIDSVLGPERGARFSRIYDITQSGNFEHGKSIANLPGSIKGWADKLGVDEETLTRELTEDRAALLAAREQRVRPGRDDKVLTDWNGLFLCALVRAYAVLEDPRYLQAAERTANRLLEPFEQHGKLVHSHLGERRQKAQLLLDYAAFGNGLLDLFLATADQRWFKGSSGVAGLMHEMFQNPEGGLYYLGAEGIAGTRSVDAFDSALPSGNSIAGNLLAKLYYVTGDETFRLRAESQLKPVIGYLDRAAPNFGQALLTADLLIHPPAQLVLVGDSERMFWKIAQENYTPRMLTLWSGAKPTDTPENSPLSALLGDKTMLDKRATAYLCRDFACDLPIVSAHKLRKTLAANATVPVH